jgi:hypothetical protein
MFEWPWQYSGADGQLCTNNGCWVEEWCMYQPCPLCEMNGDENRVPWHILVCKSQYSRSGQWIGPHCIACDMAIYLGRQLPPGLMQHKSSAYSCVQ